MSVKVKYETPDGIKEAYRDDWTITESGWLKAFNPTEQTYKDTEDLIAIPYDRVIIVED